MQKFPPSTVLITGASSGLGAALARAYAASGVTLLLFGRDQERLAQVEAFCRHAGSNVETVITDVTDSSRVAEAITRVMGRYNVDLIIANAGISGGTAGGMESDTQTNRIFATNIQGVLNTLLPAIPLMQARKSGQIAIISSLAGYRGLPSSPAYSASKGAVRLYGEALRGTLAKNNIAVTVVTPGYIETPMTAVNNFPMPFLMKVDKAANLIKRRLTGNPARIAFPLPLYLVIWLLSCLPPSWTDPLFARLPGKTPLDECE